MDFIHLWHGDRALSKILRSTIPTKLTQNDEEKSKFSDMGVDV